MRRLKIASKLLIGFGALLLLLVGLSSFSTYSSLASKGLIEQLARFKSNQVREERVQESILTARLHLWMALGSGDQTHWDQSEEAFKTASERLEDLTKSTIDPSRRARAQQLSALLQTYREIAAKFRSFGGRNEALNTPEGKAVVANAIKAGLDMIEQFPEAAKY